MRVTGLGHAGLFVETAAGSVMCYPVNPAFFGSWFPFPDNSDLDWAYYGQAADYLYDSHLHKDHFDAENLSRNVRKDATVLLPAFATDEFDASSVSWGSRTFRAPAAARLLSGTDCGS